MAKKCYKCKNEVPDGTKKCPTCGWEDRSGSRTGKKEEFQPITLHVGSPQIQNDGSFKIFTYAIVRKADGSLVEDGHRVFFHTDDMEEKADDTGDGYGQAGRADCDFNVPASRAGDTILITAHTQIGNKRYEAQKPLPLPKKKEVESAPCELEIRPHGANGKYDISIQVLAPCKKTDLVIYDDSDLSPILPGGQKKIEASTNDKGYYSFTLLAFSDNKREIQIEIIGSGANRKVPLYGPKPPKPTVKFYPQAGFWANFKQIPT